MPQSKKYYKITEIADLLGLPQSTLRWWEREIESFKPMRTPGGQRRYTSVDMETARKIKSLLHERGFSIEAASRYLKEASAKRRRPHCRDAFDAITLLGRLSEFVKDNPKALQMIESVEKYLEKNANVV